MTRFAAFFLFTVFLSAPCATGADTSNSKQAGFASFLIAAGDIDAAALEYERARAVDLNDSGVFSCTLGELYLKTDPAKAENYFSAAVEQMAHDTALRARAEQGLILSYLLQRKSALARQELADVAQSDSALFSPSTSAFLKCAVDASMYQIDSARTCLSLLSRSSAFSSVAVRIDSLLSWYRNQKMKDPAYTFVYATAVPGWGQWYNNDKRGAIAGFGLMAVLSGLIVWDGYQLYRGSVQQRYVCGMDIFLVGGLLWRRYHGSIRKAAYNQSLSINANIQLEYQKRLRAILRACP